MIKLRASQELFEPWGNPVSQRQLIFLEVLILGVVISWIKSYKGWPPSIGVYNVCVCVCVFGLHLLTFTGLLYV